MAAPWRSFAASTKLTLCQVVFCITVINVNIATVGFFGRLDVSGLNRNVFRFHRFESTCLEFI